MHNYNIGDMVNHDIDKAPFEVIGIRRDSIEIKGDFSGGTHNVCQTDWVDVDEVTLHSRSKTKNQDIIDFKYALEDEMYGNHSVMISKDRLVYKKILNNYIEHFIDRNYDIG